MFRTFAISLVLAGALVLAGQTSAPPPPASAFGALPAISGAAISEDGTRVVFGTAQSDIVGYRVIEVDSGRQLLAARLPDRHALRDVGWAAADRVSLVISRTFEPEEVLPFGYRYIGASNVIAYFRSATHRIGSPDLVYIVGDTYAAFATTSTEGFFAPIEGDPGYGRLIQDEREGRGAVMRVNLETGRSEGNPSQGDDETYSFAIDPRGRIAGCVDVVGDGAGRLTEWRVIGVDGQRRATLMSGVHPSEPPILVGAFPDRSLALLSHAEAGQRSVLLRLREGGAPETVFQNERFDIDGVTADPWTHAVVAAVWTDDFTRQHFFDEDLARIYTQISAQFTDGYALIASWSRDRRRVLVFGEHGSDGGAYYVFEPATPRLRRLGYVYPQLQGAQLGNRQAITYPARDRTRIPAYLTLPSSGPQRNLPTVLLVHGGPHTRDSFDFDYWASFLASRGYAVIQPNFRGSTGYGHDWMEAGRGQWGDGVMQTDAEDAMASLVRAGIADPQRVCIVGASYGGYAALAGATFTPGRYACSISVAGVSDVLEMESPRTRRLRAGELEWWRLPTNDPRAGRERLRAISPVNRAQFVTTPILLLHGNEDTVVPYAQSQAMNTALTAAGRSVRFVTLQGDDHWLSAASTRTQMLSEIESFLAEHLAPRPPAATTPATTPATAPAAPPTSPPAPPRMP